MDYNILSKVESVAEDFEAIEGFFEERAAEAAHKLIPDDELPPDTPSIPSSPPELPSQSEACPPLFAPLVEVQDVRIKAYRNLPECCLRNFLKGFALGTSGRYLLHHSWLWQHCRATPTCTTSHTKTPENRL